ncbi:MAG: DotU family type IV/VI secretion system protein [Isosphaeraceae bacterium]|nr:DotU family type IV/VI secretion system protein [Isosphaeraceae bacterium]
MKSSLANLVYPILSYGLDLKERLDRGEPLELGHEQQQLLHRLQPADAMHVPEFIGQGSFLGVKYALVCWLDEIFIMDSPWTRSWNEQSLETQLFETRDRYWKFWDQYEMAKPMGTDVVEAFYQCVMLGFRGRYLDSPEDLRTRMDDAKARVVKSLSQAWNPPPGLNVSTEVPPLRGRERLQRMVVTGLGVIFLLGIGAVIAMVAF